MKLHFLMSIILLAFIALPALPQQAAKVEGRLEGPTPSPRTVRENPKDGLKYVWVQPGTFMMGCSPQDSQSISARCQRTR